MPKDKYIVHWTKVYYKGSSFEIEANSQEEAEEIAGDSSKWDDTSCTLNLRESTCDVIPKDKKPRPRRKFVRK